ncbi:hypothetical protein SVIOM74S_06511 [Streptomyces violarus]
MPRPVDYPHGYLNLGLSHGVPGVAGALAAALRAGHRAPETRTALRGLVDWLLAVRLTDAQGPLWARGVPLDANGRTVPNDALPHAHDRLYLVLRHRRCRRRTAAGRRGARRRRGRFRRRGRVRRRAAARPGPRHRPVPHAVPRHGGTGGRLRRVRRLRALPNAEAALPSLVGELLAYAEDNRPLLFADQDVPGNFVDNPGLLTGAAGVALTLFAVTGRDRPRWFTAFFLS